MKELRVKLNNLIRQKADLKTIRGVLEQIAGIQVDTSYIDVETSRKVEGTLTPSQLKKWNSIQEAAVKQEIQARQLQQMRVPLSLKSSLSPITPSQVCPFMPARPTHMFN